MHVAALEPDARPSSIIAMPAGCSTAGIARARSRTQGEAQRRRRAPVDPRPACRRPPPVGDRLVAELATTGERGCDPANSPGWPTRTSTRSTCGCSVLINGSTTTVSGARCSTFEFPPPQPTVGHDARRRCSCEKGLHHGRHHDIPGRSLGGADDQAGLQSPAERSTRRRRRASIIDTAARRHRCHAGGRGEAPPAWLARRPEPQTAPDGTVAADGSDWPMTSDGSATADRPSCPSRSAKVASPTSRQPTKRWCASPRSATRARRSCRRCRRPGRPCAKPAAAEPTGHDEPGASAGAAVGAAAAVEGGAAGVTAVRSPTAAAAAASGRRRSAADGQRKRRRGGRAAQADKQSSAADLD